MLLIVFSGRYFDIPIADISKERIFLKQKKLPLPDEVAYILAIVMLSFAVAMLAAADFGISMIVAPAYLLSLKTVVLTFGQAEYVVQAVLFVVFCIVMRGFRPVYLSSFVTCLIYGAVLDLWRLLPIFDPYVTPPGSMSIRMRIPMFVIGVALTSLSIALFYRTYLYPQVYDLFVKGASQRFRIELPRFKTCFDITCLIISAVMSLCFFGKITGISWGTVAVALINGRLIGMFSDVLDSLVDTRPVFPAFAEHFRLDSAFN